MLATALLCSPAHATLSASAFPVAKTPAIVLLKAKSPRDTANDARQPNCKPAVRSMTEGQPRNCNCPKPRPILM